MREDFISYANSASYGAKMPRVGWESFGDIQFALPPVVEQRVIADFLDHETARIDALIEEQKRLIELLQEKRQAVISHAVTKGLDPDVPMKDSGVEWLGKIPEAWSVLPFRRVLNGIEQGWSPQADSRPADRDEWGVIKLSAVNRGTFLSNENKVIPSSVGAKSSLAIRDGDILLTRANTPELVGDAALVRSPQEKLLLCDLCYRIEVNNEVVNKEFLTYFLLSSTGRYQISRSAHGTSGSMVKVSHEKIKQWLLCLPPVEEQKEISRWITKEIKFISRVDEEASKAIQILKERRSALIAAAVTGKIDVRNWQPREEVEQPGYAMAAEASASYGASP